MAGYSPLKITGNQTGLVQSRENFLLPDDAYPTLQNAYVWRERILRKRGCQFLGRLQRQITISPPNNTNSLLMGLEATATLVPGSIDITGSGGITWNDPDENGILVRATPGVNGTINYTTGVIVGPTPPNTGTYNYYPGLPVMGIRTREINNKANDQTVFFDQVYAYIFNNVTNQFQEFIPGTTWNASGQGIDATNFFWSTNYWNNNEISAAFPVARKQGLFWVTNNTGFAGALADPPRITDGTQWVNFFPSTWSQIDTTNFLTNWLAMLPFRGRMLTFNTWEGSTAGNSIQYRQRIRWSAIGNPFIPYAAGPPATGSWRSDIRGKGGFLDIPTNEDIISVGFVRDNLVIYCEHSTWQLRYTGRSVAPFQIEKVNSELGAEGTFSSIQFDTSLVGIGDKGIVECDSYKSDRIDVKIPNFIFQILSQGNGTSRVDEQRVHGVRDFVNKLAYWTVPLVGVYPPQYTGYFPNQRLVYNYENDSWALFDDSFTTLGTYQEQSSRTWLNTPQTWLQSDFSWINDPVADPLIVGGNQQGFIEILNSLNFNDITLAIYDISTADPSVLYVPSHNLQQQSIISISGIPAGTPYSSLNDGVYQVELIDIDHFSLNTYSSASQEFSDPVLATPSGVFVGIGNISVRDNFSIESKKFNFLDEGQNIQLGYLDILMAATESTNPGAITLYVYLDYNNSTTSNTLPQNDISDGYGPPNADAFFNATIPTTSSSLNSIGGTKFWQRVYCPTRSNFITLEYTFSNEQMSNNVFKTEVEIDAQILWIRRAGRMTQP